MRMVVDICLHLYHGGPCDSKYGSTDGAKLSSVDIRLSSATPGKHPSRLLDLPAEIFLMITAHLSPADLLALQHCSPSTPQLIRPDSTSQADRLSFALRLDRDLCAAVCREEAAGNFVRTHLLCRRCLDIHAAYWFIEIAKRTEAEERCCRCAAVVGGVVRENYARASGGSRSWYGHDLKLAGKRKSGWVT
ncbi:hypothetical protein GTA08_BOTSDO08043 [Botryosphaeria dothidea]|uniref:F-box domain-containing protein n=1 Tax=Botryosphaeria dothidea TaxID=55169 RepID=A0A8H4IRC3_9PEZI|nr:hypothetical protein GTA08_BOTSDO08043 [Botryosphaeria dothidea]